MAQALLHKQHTDARAEETPAEIPSKGVDADKLKDDLDALLDEIDEALTDVDVVAAAEFTQKGGE